MKSQNLNMILLSKEHIVPVLSILNNIPKTRVPLSKNKFTGEIVSGFIDNKDIIFYVVELEKQYIGTIICTDIDWINRKCVLYTFIGASQNAFDIESNAIEFIVRHCFANLGLNKIVTNILSSDAYLKKIYENSGFKQDLHKRQHFFASGNYHHVSEMSILASEFLNERSKD